MKLSDILDSACVRVPLGATNKKDAIRELVDLLHEHVGFSDRDAVLAAVIAREETRSTGIGHGLAVPHGKTSGCRSLCMALGKPAEPIDFDSPDGQPCEVIVLLASPPDKTGPHIQALASISRLWLTESFRSEVSRAQTADHIYRIIREHQS